MPQVAVYWQRSAAREVSELYDHTDTVSELINTHTRISAHNAAPAIPSADPIHPAPTPVALLFLSGLSCLVPRPAALSLSRSLPACLSVVSLRILLAARGMLRPCSE